MKTLNLTQKTTKIAIIILIAFTPLLSRSQTLTIPIDPTTQKVSYQGIVRVNGVSKDDLYVRAMEWFAITFRSARNVIQMRDKAAGKIIGKGMSRSSVRILLLPQLYTQFFTISITVKDGRYRYEISDLEMQYDPDQYNPNTLQFPIDNMATNPKNKNSKGEYKGTTKKILTSINANMRALEASLRASMQSLPAGVKNKDDF